MDETSGSPRTDSLMAIGAVAVGMGGLVGAITNAVNGAVSPTCFATILRWHEVDKVWRAAIAQGISS